MARFFNRPSIQEPGVVDTSAEDDNDSKITTTSIIEEVQPVPLWSAYNSLAQVPMPNDAPTAVDIVFGLPIIKAPAHEWQTLVTSLDQLYRVNELVSEEDRKLVVTMDMDLYKRALKLEYLDSQYKNKYVLCPGAFHTVLCALRCLGRTSEGSGLDDAWQEADLYSNITVTQIINGNHHNRAIEAHQITLQVLFDLWISAFMDLHPAGRDSLRSAVPELTEACRANNDVHTAHQHSRCNWNK